MLPKEMEKIWCNGLLKQAFDEHKACINDVYTHAKDVLVTPLGNPEEFDVSMGEMPGDCLEIRKNIFSTLFQSVYQLLKIDKPRRLLYGKLNYLFRVWVTSADNLLDDEDKSIVPINMPGKSRVMRQVVSIMLADRIMKRVLDDAVMKNSISKKDSTILADRSLQILLPSAAEESSEEGGITERPDPDYVLYTIHKLKTGLLFLIPFLGPENIESDIDKNSLQKCKYALGRFGLGCQILDDIRDMARDYIEKRHNYVLSKIYREKRYVDMVRLEQLECKIDVSSKIHQYFLEPVNMAAALSGNLLQEGLSILDEAGLGIDEVIRKKMVLSMFEIMDVGDQISCLKQKVPAQLLQKAGRWTMPQSFMTS